MRELADANDSLYMRRPNLRFEGIPEPDHGEDTDAKVLEIANSKKLKTYNKERQDQQHIFINDDLTPR